MEVSAEMTTNPFTPHSTAELRAWVDDNSDDPRWRAIRRGLRQLSPSQLRNLAAWLERGKPLAVDTFNFDPDRQLWCPLAIGLQVPDAISKQRLPQPKSNSEGQDVIRVVGQEFFPGFSLNSISGTPGQFFRSERYRDLLLMCRYLAMYPGIQ